MADWIKFEKQQPPRNKPVLAFYESPFFKKTVMVVALNFDGSGVMRAVEKGGIIEGITHWMPLPTEP